MRVRVQLRCCIPVDRLFPVHSQSALTRVSSKMATNIVNGTSKCDVQKNDQTCCYKFDWGWLEEIPDSVDDTQQVRLGDFIWKVDVAGKVLCQWCGDTINYASRSCAAVLDHVKTKKQCEDTEEQLLFILRIFKGAAPASAWESTDDKIYGIHPRFKKFVGKGNEADDVEVLKPITSLDDRSTNLQVRPFYDYNHHHHDHHCRNHHHYWYKIMMKIIIKWLRAFRLNRATSGRL